MKPIAAPNRCSSNRSRVPLSAGVLLFLAGCAGGPLQRFTGEDVDLSRELPEEFRDRFEIREVDAPAGKALEKLPEPVEPNHAVSLPGRTAPTPTSSPSPSPSPSSSGKPGLEPSQSTAPVSGIPGFGRGSDSGSNTDSSSFSSAVSGAKKRKSGFPNRRPKVDPIWLGEKHHFRISFLGVKVGECWMEVMPFKEINERKAYHVKGHAISVNPFRMLYRIDNDIETLFDYRSIVSHRFRLLLDESKQTRDAVELNDHERGVGFYWNRLNQVDKGYSEKKKFTDIPLFAQDTLSQLYFLRTIPLRDGETFSFPLATEGKVAETTVTVIGREEIDTIFGRVKAVKIRPVVRFHGILKPAGDSHVWLSDDDRRIVLRIEARVKIGAVYGDLMAFDRGLPPGPGQGRDDEPVVAVERMVVPARPAASGGAKGGRGAAPKAPASGGRRADDAPEYSQ